LIPIENNLIWTFVPASKFASVSEQWQQLCDRSLASPLLSADFIAVALNHFGRGDELICFAQTSKTTVAAIILQRRNSFVWESFQPSQMPLGPCLLVLQSDLPTILKSLLRALPLPATILAVTKIDSQFFPRAPGNELLCLDSITTGEIDLPASLDAFVNSINSKPLTRRMRKAEREIGPISLVTQTNPEAVDDFVNLYAAIENRGWKGESGTALVPQNAQAKFYCDLLWRFAATGRARMYTLKMGERDVAAQMAIAENDTLYLLKTTYEQELGNLGPGVILHYYLTLDGYQQQRRIRRIEFYGQLNDSQKAWITGSRSIYHLNIYRPAILARIHRHLIERRTRGNVSGSTDASEASVATTANAPAQ
jgi:CelD/BcsL family acetyltransferase involved in cellulose biosynthesis